MPDHYSPIAQARDAIAGARRARLNATEWEKEKKSQLSRLRPGAIRTLQFAARPSYSAPYLERAAELRAALLAERRRNTLDDLAVLSLWIADRAIRTLTLTPNP